MHQSPRCINQKPFQALRQKCNARTNPQWQYELLRNNSTPTIHGSWGASKSSPGPSLEDPGEGSCPSPLFVPRASCELFGVGRARAFSMTVFNDSVVLSNECIVACIVWLYSECSAISWRSSSTSSLFRALQAACDTRFCFRLRAIASADGRLGVGALRELGSKNLFGLSGLAGPGENSLLERMSACPLLPPHSEQDIPTGSLVKSWL